MKKCGSYHHFLKKYEKDYTVSLSQQEENVLEYFSRKLLSYKRIHELALLKNLFTQMKKGISPTERVSWYWDRLQKNYHVEFTEMAEDSMIRNLRNEFPKEEERKKYADCILIEKNQDGTYIFSAQFYQMLENQTFRTMIEELLDFGIGQYEEKYAAVLSRYQFCLVSKIYL